MYQNISDYSYALQEKSVSYRRDFHKYPETGWLEMRTSAVIAKVLTGLGYEVLTGRDVCEPSSRMGVPSDAALKEHADLVKRQNVPLEFMSDDMQEGFTGVVGILRCGKGPVVALRFDIDALGLCEIPELGHRPSREGFASVHEGMMHACGHDGHAAIGLTTAEILVKIRDKLHGTVKLLFQPGEEGARGAKAMVDKGHLDDVDYLIGAHIAPDGGPDNADVTPGTYGSLATAKYDMIFHGKAAHAGGFPEQGSNALLAAACAAMNLAAIPRHSEGASRINIGTLHAGTGRNVIPDEAVMEVEVRGETTKINRYMGECATRICRSAAKMYDCTCEIRLMGAAESQYSDPELVERISVLIKNHLPGLRVSGNPNAKNWGSEDISLMMNRVKERGGQAVYMRLMTTMSSAQHTRGFDFDESVLTKGTVTFASIVYNLLQGKKV